jgi:Na+/proline symporter
MKLIVVVIIIIIIIIIIIMTVQLFVGPLPLFQFLDPVHSRYHSLDGDQPVARPVPTHRTA